MSGAPARLAFDVTPAVSGRTGIARYVIELGAALERAGGVQLRRFAIGRRPFAGAPGAAGWAAAPERGAMRRVAIPARVVGAWWRAASWPRLEQLIGPVELVHATGALAPPTRRPLVVTVHDLAALRYPELHPRRHIRQQRALLSALRGAAAVVPVSCATADDLAHLGIAAERMVVAPLGVSPLAAPAPAPERPPPGYLLTVGESSPRKGYAVVLHALAHLDGTHRLVMAGPPAGDEARLRQLIAGLGLRERVTRVGAVSDSMLAGLYAGALALCFPSVSEGFGLPLLEAMSAGVPVLASDIPSTREVVGEAAIYLDRWDERAWAEAIEGLARDPSLRSRLSAAGRRRAGAFTWERTAKATLEAYRLALAAAG
jgi:glycosyltransferase involved in cell wall biosynthesis